MTFFLCLLYLLLVVALGYAVFSVVHPGPASLGQLTGLVPALGAGTMGWLLFWCSLAGWAPSRGLLAGLGGAVLAGLLTLAKFRRLAPVSRAWRPREWAGPDLLVWLAMALVLGLVVAGSVAVPLVDWDSFAIWGFKAKVLLHEPLHPTPAYFHDLTLSYSHLDYPLLVPFLTAGAYAAMGMVDEPAGKLVSLLLGGLLAPLVYLGLRWKLPRRPAACLCLLLVLQPTFLRYAGDGCADLPLATFYAGSIIFIARWLELQQPEELIFAVLFTSFLVFTKNEGLVLALINGLVLLVQIVRKSPPCAGKNAVRFALGTLVLVLPWLVWRHYLPRTHENYGPKLVSTGLLASLPKLPHVLWEMFFRVTSSPGAGSLWLLAGLLAVPGRRAFSFSQPGVQTLWWLLGLQVLAYALVYCVTPWDLDLLLTLSLDRLLWHAVPAVILLAGWHWAAGAMLRAPAPGDLASLPGQGASQPGS